MKKQVLVTVVLAWALGGCMPQTSTNTRKTTSSTSNTSGSSIVITDSSNGSNLNDSGFIDTSSNTTNTNTSTTTGSGTGSGSGTGTGTGSTTIPDSGSGLTQYCGKLYRSKSGNLILIKDDDLKYYTVFSKSTNASSSIATMKFPNDAYNACIWGTQTLKYAFTNSTFNNYFSIYAIDAQYVQLSDVIYNPERESKANQYAYTLCGSVKYHIDNGQTEKKIQIRSGNLDYILVDKTTSKQLEAYMNTNGFGNGCVYSNLNPYTNYSVTFKKFFDVSAIDLGW